jgi:pantoate--beta-alanine ligase
MKVVTTVAAARAEDRSGRRVLVPTMGALHRGHLELIHVARDHAALGGEVVVSSFVNPLQFEPGSDFDRYPRLEKADEELCASAGVDFLFRPGVGEMYFDDRSVVVDEMMLSQTLCGQSRPGHFRGVCTVVAKIFNVLQPAVAVFGEKDFQQLAIVRRMVRDLNFPVQIIGVPTVREEDGLALSSRNQYLSAPEREQAPILRRALLRGAELVAAGEKIAAEIVRSVRATVEQASLARVDYIELVDASTLQPVERITSDAVLALAVFFGKTRLIDNIRLP